MSGLSLAVGPRHGHDKPIKEADDGSPKGLMSSIRTIELQLVAFIVVFSASGLVPVTDLLFPVFVTPYLFMLSRFVFPTYNNEGRMEVFHGSRMFQLYLMLGTVLGLFLPLAYVLGGFARGDQHAVRASTPHLFLLSVQILSENVVSNLAVWSPPVRAFLVTIYNGRRIFSLGDWISDVFTHVAPPQHPTYKDLSWVWFGRGLAAANLVYFVINLFCFVLPRFIPRAFERYFQAKASFQASNQKVRDEKDPSDPKKAQSEKKAK
ncbi:hypothetical protein KP509_03G096600 [Ceratopteris richardii]|uniref:DUF7733 domain-containing protein n=1 Tax=Ceratopteris richardii TaxID=49495 RepID=A0A8T2V2F6_CERRI|nr:hypothetical protein KP509_03G096600 [Ceratopteris richardii]KAH7442618.1 hypothetical protein KP509_03G096600 [Ceratopteris richardii]